MAKTMHPSEDTVEKELSEESDSSSPGSKPQLSPAHEWSDDCVSEKTEEEHEEEEP